MELSLPIMEAVMETTHANNIPLTSTFRPNSCMIHKVKSSRQVLDFDKAGQSRDRPNANRFFVENGFGTAIVVQYIFGIEDTTSGELWNCTIRSKGRKLFVENGLFIIEVEISPNGLVCFPKTDITQNQLPNHLANIKFILPVEDDPLVYEIVIKLFMINNFVKTQLDCVMCTVPTHYRGHDVYDYQEGRGIMNIEKPQLKIAKTGILSQDVSRQVIAHFEFLRDNGFYEKFFADKEILLQGLCNMEETFGLDFFRDIKLSIMLEESCMFLATHNKDECLRIAKEVIKNIQDKQSPNGPFLMAVAHNTISALYRQSREFDMASEHMALSTELLESVVVGPVTASNQYNLAALLSERAVHSTLSATEEKDAIFKYQNCLSHWAHQTENQSNRYPIKTQIGYINHNLHTSRQKFPNENKQVSPDEFERAAKAIEYVEKYLIPDAAERHKVVFFIAKSDFYIRKAMMMTNSPYYTNAEHMKCAKEAYMILQEAFKKATKLNLEKELVGITLRMTRLVEMYRLEVPPLGNTRERNAPQEQDEQEMMPYLLNELQRVAFEELHQLM